MKKSISEGRKSLEPGNGEEDDKTKEERSGGKNILVNLFEQFLDQHKVSGVKKGTQNSKKEPDHMK